MKTVLPTSENSLQFYNYLTSAVAPRPICFASTIDNDGLPNLSPFSFFTIVGNQPPMLAFSTLRRMRNGTTKHTYENVKANSEVVINVVTSDIVEQASLSSCEYPDGTDEFLKAGFTKLTSDFVKPFRVAESPVQIECKVAQVIDTSDKPGAGSLILCEVLAIHINPAILNEDETINPHAIKLVARMGKNYYSRAFGEAVFEVEKPNVKLGIGFDGLPENIKNSTILTGNDLAKLANVTALPEPEPGFYDEHIKKTIEYYILMPDELEIELHRYARKMLADNRVEHAWQVLLSV